MRLIVKAGRECRRVGLAPSSGSSSLWCGGNPLGPQVEDGVKLPIMRVNRTQLLGSTSHKRTYGELTRESATRIGAGWRRGETFGKRGISGQSRIKRRRSRARMHVQVSQSY
jgi:hypothetical protein